MHLVPLNDTDYALVHKALRALEERCFVSGMSKSTGTIMLSREQAHNLLIETDGYRLWGPHRYNITLEDRGADVFAVIAKRDNG